MTKRITFLAVMILTPILVFYGLLAHETVNLPYLDDYGVLRFVCDWSQLQTLHDKLGAIIGSQHNEYKVMFANAIYALQYLSTGHVNFAVLSAFGNFFVLPLYLVLYRMWAADRRAIEERVLLFVPVSWMLFQLQYYSLLSWPGSTLQNIPVVFFSLLAIQLLSRDTQGAFYLSLVSLALAIASSGNGFFVIPVGCLMLIQFRRPARIAGLLCVSVAMLAVYLHGYNFNSSQSHADHSVVSSLHHISPLYALSLLGASIARYGSYIPAAILGGCLCGAFLYSIFDKFYIKNPAIFYSICFILITSVAISGLRSDLGTAQSLVSRYRIYSNLMLVFFYLYGAEKLYPADETQKQHCNLLSRSRIATTAAVIAVAFNIGSNYAGFRLLRARTELTKQGMRRWEMGKQSITTAPGPANEDPVIRRQRLSGDYEPQTQYLQEAMLLHIYSPPLYGSGDP